MGASVCSFIHCEPTNLVSSQPHGLWFLGNTLDEQLKLAARAVSGLLEFKDKLDNKRLPIQKSADGNPMDMSQVIRYDAASDTKGTKNHA